MSRIYGPLLAIALLPAILTTAQIRAAPPMAPDPAPPPQVAPAQEDLCTSMMTPIARYCYQAETAAGIQFHFWVNWYRTAVTMVDIPLLGDCPRNPYGSVLADGRWAVTAGSFQVSAPFNPNIGTADPPTHTMELNGSFTSEATASGTLRILGEASPCETNWTATLQVKVAPTQEIPEGGTCAFTQVASIPYCFFAVTPQLSEFDFWLAADRSSVRQVSMAVLDDCSIQAGSALIEGEWPIQEGSFQVSASSNPNVGSAEPPTRTLELKGTFSSPDQASGTILVSSDASTCETTWTARLQMQAEPEPTPTPTQLPAELPSGGASPQQGPGTLRFELVLAGAAFLLAGAWTAARLRR